MKKTTIEKVVQFESCSNTDVAGAVLKLAMPLFSACGNDNEMKKVVFSLAIEGWNLSLFRESDESYLTKIQKKIPANISEDNRNIFTGFVLQIIKKKQEDFGGMKKGITDYTIQFDDGSPTATVKTLPVNPKQI